MPSPRVADRLSEQDAVHITSRTHPIELDARDGGSPNGGSDNKHGGNPGSSSSGQSNTGGGGGSNPSQGDSCTETGTVDGNQFNLIEDSDPGIAYLGNWTILAGNAMAGDATQHITTDPTASLQTSFSGTSISVIGTIPNGSEPITVNYTIDGGPPQTRSVLASLQCNITLNAFFAVSGLKNGSHVINITMVTVSTRPYEFNFLTLDRKGSSTPYPKKSDAGKIAGGVIGGLLLLALICGFAFYLVRKRRCDNIYVWNRANDARLQQWVIPQDAFNHEAQKQSSLFGSSMGSIRESVPTFPSNTGQRQNRGGLTRIFGSSRGSTPSWVTSNRDTISTQMRFSENPALPRPNVPPAGVGALANANIMASHFSPNTSMAFSPPAGKWDEPPVNDARTREMSQITESQMTTATTPRSLNALASHFSPNTSVALSAPAFTGKWEDVLASVKEASGAGNGHGAYDGQVPPGQARGRMPSIIIEDQPNRLSAGQTIHSAVSGSEDGHGRAM